MNRKQLVETIRDKRSFLCVGLDTDVNKMPAHLSKDKNGIIEFNKALIDATKDHCVGYKINTAFYESMGVKGWEIIEETLHYIPSSHFKIADAKRGDIGNTSAQYAKTFFETFPFDAVTVAPYMGEDSIRPFLEYENKWTIVLGLTSNAGSNDFQRLIVQKNADELSLVQGPNRNKAVYEKVIEKIASWGTTENLMFVIGATQTADLENVRSIIPEHFLLVPGVGAQGGSLEDVVKYGMNEDVGLLINASRAVIYASVKKDFAEAAAFAARDYQQEMQAFMK
ncbi:MAG: pyrF [Chitinophagaceae bacterium]|nr:pyrF [Chitinophagaceae bacterium]